MSRTGGTSHHDAERLSSNMVETREGYLLCKDVPLARTGTQTYMSFEVPVPGGPGGRVEVERPEDEVFHPDAIDSFRGKPFTDDHPYEDVGPANYKKHFIGVVQNPRRGEGELSHCLIGDILVYDPTAIKKIKSGEKREISCGYDADYKNVVPGRGVQTNIRGNHVSLVDAGRCGDTCSIKDRSLHLMAKKPVKKNWKDSLLAAFRNKDDAAEMEKHLGDLEASLDEPEEPDFDGGDSDGGDKSHHHHVTVNVGGQEVPSLEEPTNDAEPGAGDKPEMCTKDDLNAALAEIMQPVMERLDAMQSRIDEMGEAVESVSGDPEDMATQDAVARAEVLKPGVQIPAFDARPGSKSARDALTNFQRNVLSQAWATADGREAIQPLVGSGRPDFGRMSPETVGVVFRGASQAMHDRNSVRVTDTLVSAAASGSAGFIKDANGNRRVMDNATWNAQKDKFYGRSAH